MLTYADVCAVTPDTSFVPQAYLQLICDALKDNTSILLIDLDNCGTFMRP
jgi:hypothetical protein